MEVNQYSQNYGQGSNQQILAPQGNIFPQLNNIPQQNIYLQGNIPPQQNIYPFQPNIYPPAQPIMNTSPEMYMPQPGFQFVYVQNPMSELEGCTNVEIMQQPEFFEAITGCETANRYHIYGQTSQGYKYLFKCKEKSDWFMRNCCPSEQREFNMDIIHVISPNPMNPSFSKKFANAYKPFKCTVCCLCRPELIVILNDGNMRIGKVHHAFNVCDPKFEIFDENNNLKFIVYANCCQCGLLCANNIFGKMSEAIFEILIPTNNQIIGNITKKRANLNEMVTDADTYQINFPSFASAKDKLLIIALGLMIDYQYFETDTSDQHQGHGGRGNKRRPLPGHGPHYH